MNPALAIGLVLALAAATFQRGGADPGAAPLLAALLAALALVGLARRPAPSERPLGAAVLLASVPLAVSALELIPLPHAAVAAVAPATARLLEKDGEAEPSARPLSMDPGTSRRALERGVALVATFLLAARLARYRRNAKLLVLLLLGLGALVAIAGLGLSDVSPDALFGGRARAPFKNPNHFSTFLEILLPLALGLALEEPPRDAPPPSFERLADRPDVIARLAGLAGVGLFAAGIVQSKSRAGAGAAALGGLVALAGWRARPRHRIAVLATLVLAGALGVASVDLRGNVERLKASPENLSARVEYWKIGFRVLEGRELVGSGLGTFDPASFAQLTSETSSILYVRPERAHNDYVNLASDLGVPAALAGIAAVLVVAASVARRIPGAGERSALAAGALGGAVAALAHASFDFGLELMPVGALFAAVLGVAAGASAPPREAGEPKVSTWARRGAVGLLLAAIVVLTAIDAVAERAAAAAGDDEKKVAAARRWAPDDAELAARDARLLRRADALEAAIAAGRDACRLSPASARSQAELALALLDAARTNDALRKEGEKRLGLALELGPDWPSLHFSAGCYWLDRTAATGDRESARRALSELEQAIRLQLPDQPSYRTEALRRVRALLDEGKLGAIGEELLRALAAP